MSDEINLTLIDESEEIEVTVIDEEPIIVQVLDVATVDPSVAEARDLAIAAQAAAVAAKDEAIVAKDAALEALESIGDVVAEEVAEQFAAGGVVYALIFG